MLDVVEILFGGVLNVILVCEINIRRIQVHHYVSFDAVSPAFDCKYRRTSVSRSTSFREVSSDNFVTMKLSEKVQVVLKYFEGISWRLVQSWNFIFELSFQILELY